MKNVMLLLAVVVALSSCNNIEQLRQPIETLSSNWDSTTTQVTDLLGQVNSEAIKAEAMVKRLEFSDSAASNLSEDVKSQAASIQQDFKAKMEELSTLKSGMSEFATTWKEKASDLEALTSGLQAGQLPEGAAGSVKNLQDMISTAQTNLTDWSAKFETIRTTFSELYNKFVTLRQSAGVEQTEADS